MYKKFFGLKEAPFRLTPDTAFYYAYPIHQEALNVLSVALDMGEGFLKVTGEVGTGKTLVCRQMLNMLGDEYITAFIPNPCLSPVSLRQTLADELGVKYDRNTRQQMLVKLIARRLIQFKRAGKKVVLLLDEAQALPDKSIEALRLLTNLETEKSKLLHVVLFGQPELDVRLQQPHLRQLLQRITFSYKLKPMSLEGIAGYIDHRLKVSGYNGPPLFTKRAIRKVYKASGGIPRLVHVLSHKSLMSAYGQGARLVDTRHVTMAIADTEGAKKSAFSPRRLWAGFANTAASVMAVGFSFIMLSGFDL